MSRLAFHNRGKYTDFEKSYELYCKRCKKSSPVNYQTYKNIVREYCKCLADRLANDGMVDLPSNLGTIIVSDIRRKPQYRGDKFVGYGKMNWKEGRYDGSNKALGIVFLARRDKTENLRSFGFVANRRLFYRIKELFDSGLSNWQPMEFNETMI